MVVRWFLFVYLFVLLLGAAALGLQMTLIHLDNRYVSTPHWLWDVANDSVTWIEQFLVIFFFATSIPFLRWTYLAVRNAHAFRERSTIRGGLDAPTVSPGWAVGFYFIPFANFWLPYIAMKETNKIGAALSGIDARRLLPWWWFFWIIAKFIPYVVANLYVNAETNDEIFQANAFYILTRTADVALTILAILVVARITKAQRITQHRLDEARQMSAPLTPV